MLTCINFTQVSENDGEGEKLGFEKLNNNNNGSPQAAKDGSYLSTRTSRTRGGIQETHERGGSWVDDFDDLKSIESKSNLSFIQNHILARNYFRLNSSFSNFSESFEGTDGTQINSYNSAYSVWTNADSGKCDVEIDTAQNYDGSSSLLINMTQWSKRTYVERSVNFSKPVLELTFFIRIYCGPLSRDAHVGSANSFLLKSGSNLVAGIDFYGRNIRYPNSGGSTSTFISPTHSTWHMVRMVIYKNNGAYSKYDFDVWKTNNLQSPIVSKRSVNVFSTGHSYIDNFNISMGTVWETPPPDPFYYVWYDDISIIETGFETNGILQSKPITLPTGMSWDSFTVNKTEPSGSSIDIHILNANNNQIIYGPITTNDEVDISSKVNSINFKSIKLRATFNSHGVVTPLLRGWGVSWNASNVWRDSFYEGLKADKQYLTSYNGEVWQSASKTDFYRYSGNPILPNGPTSSWDSNEVSRHWVIYNGTGYMMWFTGVDSSNKWEIGLATSSDGISWTKYSGNPVLTVGGSGTWESGYIGRPTVIFDGKEYIMIYQGKQSTNPKIGFATSVDGINWNKYPNNPVLDQGASGLWDERGVNCPNVFSDGVSYKLWFSGLTNGNNLKAGYASSYDCIHWTKYQNNPILTGPSGNGAGVGNMHVIPLGNQYYGWYNHDFGSYSEIYLAYSSDEVSWIKSSSNPVLRRGASSSWDSQSVHSPCIMFKNKQYYLYYSGRSSSATQQIGLAKSKFITNGVLTSKPIFIPAKHYYGKLIINKTEPAGSYINISILDGITGQTINNFKDITKESIDLSIISSIAHPAIKINATFESNGYRTPILHDWSINWTANMAPKIKDIDSIPILNRTYSEKIIINLTDPDEPECNLSLRVKYKAPSDLSWQTKYLIPPNFVIDHWECTFTPDAYAELGHYDFFFECNDSLQCIDSRTNLLFIEVVNNDPIIWNITTDKLNADVKRTNLIKININASDIETPANYLKFEIKYKSPVDIEWQTKYISDILYDIDHWEVEFTPARNQPLGRYIINITCRDNETGVYDHIIIYVLNNAPFPPELKILPDNPKTRDDLTVKVLNAEDIETPFNKLKFWYRWYRDNYYMSKYDNSTIIPASETTKDQTWRCVVYPFDGVELGSPSEVQTKILNSPPELVEELNVLEMFEDTPIVLNGTLMKIFDDPDNDTLEFSVTGKENIVVEIEQKNGSIKLIPSEDWFGTEFLTFSANDSFFDAKETVQIIVNPTNDLPIFSQIGNQYISDSSHELQFIVKQDSWLNLTIYIEDIDGDVERGMITYIPNITQSLNLYFRDHDNTLVFHPKNEDVGWHYINITITDNNETPTEYVWQHIKIRVLNVNDPPTVDIIIPENDLVVSKSDVISFKCVAQDIDLLVWNSAEQLKYRWYTNKTEFGNLGTTSELINISLPPGFYNFTVEVEDVYGAKAYDFVHIWVKELPEKEARPIEFQTNIYLWLGLLILFLVILLISILLFISKRKKKRVEAIGILPPQVLQPDAAYLPGTPSIAPGAQLAQPQIISAEPIPPAPTQELLGPRPTVATTAEPQAQLPPPQPTIAPEITEVEEQAGIDSKLSPREKIALLEERFVKGEVDQDVYLYLKAKFEMEAKPFEPAPQLPPPSTPIPTTVSPPPEPTIQPQTVTPSEITPPDQVEPVSEMPLDTELPSETTEQAGPQLPPLPAGAYQQTQPPQPQQVPQQYQPPQTQSQISQTQTQQPTQTQPTAQPQVQQVPQPQVQQAQQPEQLKVKKEQKSNSEK